MFKIFVVNFLIFLNILLGGENVYLQVPTQQNSRECKAKGKVRIR